MMHWITLVSSMLSSLMSLKVFGEGEGIDMEMLCWETKWKKWPDKVPSSPQEAYRHADSNYYPNINVLLKLMCTIPVTTCSCERSISGLRRLKTYLRSTIGQLRLNGLALMHFHYGLDIDYEAIINDFARKHPRRMELTNLIDEAFSQDGSC